MTNAVMKSIQSLQKVIAGIGYPIVLSSPAAATTAAAVCAIATTSPIHTDQLVKKMCAGSPPPVNPNQSVNV